MTTGIGKAGRLTELSMAGEIDDSQSRRYISPPDTDWNMHTTPKAFGTHEGATPVCLL
jgi:hypothetical protein